MICYDLPNFMIFRYTDPSNKYSLIVTFCPTNVASATIFWQKKKTWLCKQKIWWCKQKIWLSKQKIWLSKQKIWLSKQKIWLSKQKNLMVQTKKLMVQTKNLIVDAKKKRKGVWFYSGWLMALSLFAIWIVWFFRVWVNFRFIFEYWGLDCWLVVLICVKAQDFLKNLVRVLFPFSVFRIVCKVIDGDAFSFVRSTLCIRIICVFLFG